MAKTPVFCVRRTGYRTSRVLCDEKRTTAARSGGINEDDPTPGIARTSGCALVHPG
ncbi:MAG TPA: hypothetical protein HA276_07865 [Candidatus Poseidoniaceae archaeon]|nr:hypothetical protein [Candidatus Poseidoniaceae archaeon]